MKNITCFALVACLGVCFSGVAQASIALTQADFLGMTVTSSNGLTGGAALTANPTYGDGQPGMSGFAGATGNLNPFIPGGTAEVFYGFGAGPLALFTAGSVFTVTSHNDNNQDWEIGLWYDAGAGVVESGSTIAAGFSQAESVVLPVGVTAAGVYVRNVLAPVQADDFHASWSVPEATSFLVWGGLAMVGACRRRRSR